MKDKTDKVLDTSSGIISMLIGVFGLIAVLFLRSPEVTLPFTIIGVLGFGSLFMYGLDKATSASNYNV